ncbi:hypothetical protein, conserved [Trypanosoma brucei gambiense DAL972]|uniref:J domain-containing protein n=2 Tax=Trypanosoma brucei TaxID=5691 RepID=D0A0B6_TRYB9|nr:hypothetical protein, conserved [Trypanosoma brucei gambiense DAL972]XP_011778951.1 hypothetical protein, conserved [Trypanosoma brucei gambiense DAL972]RHW69245.1 hypothetical protein DPX39_100154600 [Trypanosoma brucei equiperdum]RHW69429.1 hypothetical protein DPX39_100153400 [Trypanosoma brucei equiperdum]CBH16674.1 hypothetical protein, conserved [Trypanosoma brucei gambiense DAL972]CBH16687.1 hypothetical protein, conserved [Trypanosoma brucei gambiense DAL972]|eukprot:XP_011778938.1 hypothetical protein, conserved [Trypanosoma brucei gambiense DAL972]
MIPRAAQIRQQQAQERRNKLEESAARAAREDVFARHNAMYGVQRPNSRFANTNRYSRRDPNRGIITQAEWDAVVGEHENSGSMFRIFFSVAVVIAISLLALAKYDVEFNLEPPQIESGKGFGEVNPTHDGAVTPSEAESYYEILGVKGRIRPKSTGAAADEAGGEDLDKERRRENYRIRQEIRKAYKEHQDARGQLVHCGRACEAKNQQVELAYNRLASQVDRELFSVLLDTKDTKDARSVDPAELKRAYETKKKLVEETEKNEEDRSMVLEELKDAYDILVNPEARNYYLLYGIKPPEHMRYTSARSGGWGQEMTLGTFKYRVIISWLDFMQEYIGLWGETIVLLCAVGFVLSRLPAALRQSESIMEDLEWEDAIEEERRRNGE